MHLLRNIAGRFVPLAGGMIALALLVYLSVQQSWRHAANDPQVQMAGDIRDTLNRDRVPPEAVLPSRQIDIADSLSPFVSVLDDAGNVVATSGRLRGQARTVPAGVLDHARVSGEERVTWQPEPGVRVAAVVMPVAGALRGFVVVGRSLRESEARTRQFGQLTIGLLGASLAGVLVLVALSESLLKAVPD
jgi:hypothetical protein